MNPSSGFDNREDLVTDTFARLLDLAADTARLHMVSLTNEKWDGLEDFFPNFCEIRIFAKRTVAGLVQ